MVMKNRRPLNVPSFKKIKVNWNSNNGLEISAPMADFSLGLRVHYEFLNQLEHLSAIYPHRCLEAPVLVRTHTKKEKLR